MKAFLLLLFSLLFISLSSCRNTDNKMQNKEEEDVVDSLNVIPKATAIFWIDKDKHLYSQQKKHRTPVRTVKVKVNIKTSGQVEVLSYVKNLDSNLHQYLQDRLEVFRVSKIMLDSGFVKPGEQYVQLRYTPSKIRK